LYSAVKNAYLGFIPNEQTNFVEKIREEIRKQKMERGQMGQVVMNPSNPGGMPTQQGPSGLQLQQQSQGMQQVVVSQQQTMPGGMSVPSMAVGPSTSIMAGGTLTMTSGM
jgi:mediator of RNA polymerase II transcription subunit 25